MTKQTQELYWYAIILSKEEKKKLWKRIDQIKYEWSLYEILVVHDDLKKLKKYKIQEEGEYYVLLKKDGSKYTIKKVLWLS